MFLEISIAMKSALPLLAICMLRFCTIKIAVFPSKNLPKVCQVIKRDIRGSVSLTTSKNFELSTGTSPRWFPCRMHNVTKFTRLVDKSSWACNRTESAWWSIVEKYQHTMFSEQGVSVSRKTLVNWWKYKGYRLKPVVTRGLLFTASSMWFLVK